MKCHPKCGFVVLAAVAVLALPRHGYAQQMNFSFYADEALSSDVQTLYTIVDGSDNSSGCSHWDYQTYGQVSGPSGFFDGYFPGLNSYIDVPAMNGNYSIVSNLTVSCSCFGSGLGAGGASDSVALESYFARYRNSGFQVDCWSGFRKYDAYLNCNHACQEGEKCFPAGMDKVEVFGFRIRGRCTPGAPYPSEQPLCKAPGES